MTVSVTCNLSLYATRLGLTESSKTVRILLHHELERALKAVRIAVGEFVEKNGLPSLVPPRRRDMSPERSIGLYRPVSSPGGNPPPRQGFQAKATFILAEESHRTTPPQYREGKESQHRQVLSEFFMGGQRRFIRLITLRSHHFGGGSESLVHPLMDGFIGSDNIQFSGQPVLNRRVTLKALGLC